MNEIIETNTMYKNERLFIQSLKEGYKFIIDGGAVGFKSKIDKKHWFKTPYIKKLCVKSLIELSSEETEILTVSTQGVKSSSFIDFCA
jgi:hypothetical protein